MDSFKDQAAYTPKEFRQAYRLGHSKFHEMKKAGLAPRETVIGGKHLIFADDVAAWRRKMTELSSAALGGEVSKNGDSSRWAAKANTGRQAIGAAQ
jgi:hypothetical protein